MIVNMTHDAWCSDAPEADQQASALIGILCTEYSQHLMDHLWKCWLLNMSSDYHRIETYRMIICGQRWLPHRWSHYKREIIKWIVNQHLINGASIDDNRFVICLRQAICKSTNVLSTTAGFKQNRITCIMR